LSESVRNKGVKLVVVLPTVSEESAAYLDELGLSGVEVKQASLKDIQVGGTPTLILLDGKGEVTRYWVGKLPSEKETEVLEQLTS
jgi:thioredoxin-related protein